MVLIVLASTYFNHGSCDADDVRIHFPMDASSNNTEESGTHSESEVFIWTTSDVADALHRAEVPEGDEVEDEDDDATGGDVSEHPRDFTHA